MTVENRRESTTRAIGAVVLPMTIAALLTCPGVSVAAVCEDGSLGSTSESPCEMSEAEVDGADNLLDAAAIMPDCESPVVDCGVESRMDVEEFTDPLEGPTDDFFGRDPSLSPENQQVVFAYDNADALCASGDLVDSLLDELPETADVWNDESISITPALAVDDKSSFAVETADARIEPDLCDESSSLDAAEYYPEADCAEPFDATAVDAGNAEAAEEAPEVPSDRFDGLTLANDLTLETEAAPDPVDTSLEANAQPAAPNGWVEDADATRYYRNGTMLTGKQAIDGSTHYFAKDDGSLVKAKWVATAKNTVMYFDAAGDALYDYQTIYGIRYHFDHTTGAMVSDQVVTENDGQTRCYDDLGHMVLGEYQMGEYWYYADPQTGGRVTDAIAHPTGKADYYGYYDKQGIRRSVGRALGSTSLRSMLNSCYSTPTTAPGYCSEWITNVGVNAGIGSFDGDACDMYYAWCTSSKRSELKAGMLVSVSTHANTVLGRIYGHVAIYLGGGTVIDSVGYVRTMDLDDWLDHYGTTVAPMWGWFGGIELS